VKVVDVLPFRLGRAAAEPLNASEVAFYSSLAASIAGEPCTLVKGDSRITIPVESKVVNSNPGDMYGRFVNAAEKIPPSADILIVDLTSPNDADIRGGFEVHVGRAIENVLQEHPGTADNPHVSQLILLLSELPPEGDALRHLLEPFFVNQRSVLIADSGVYLPEGAAFSNFDQTRYRVELARMRGEPLELLKLKMIRRLGHFERKKGQKRQQCVRHFFDGRFCAAEIRQLIARRISKSYSKPETPYVLYHSTISSWLEGPVLRAAAELNLVCRPVDDVINETRCAKELVRRSNIFLIVPLVDSGQTLINIVAQLRKKVSIERLEVFSILSTSGAKEFSGTRKLGRGKSSFDVAYAYRVTQDRYAPAKCPMCTLDIPHSPIGQEPFAMLTSYDFWDMVRAHPLISEKNVPRNRPGLENVPDFAKILDSNGPWLASKVTDLLHMASNEPVSDSVIVCPDEEGSQILVRYLDIVTGATVIHIPREIIDLFYDGFDFAALEKQWQNTQPAWFVALSTLSAQEVVVIDEFSRSRGTFDALRRLLFEFHTSIRCFVSMADFHSKDSEPIGIPHYSLYKVPSYDDTLLQ
jgi:hypothetical protein